MKYQDLPKISLKEINGSIEYFRGLEEKITQSGRELEFVKDSQEFILYSKNFSNLKKASNRLKIYTQDDFMKLKYYGLELFERVIKGESERRIKEMENDYPIEKQIGLVRVSRKKLQDAVIILYNYSQILPYENMILEKIILNIIKDRFVEEFFKE